MKRCPVCQTMLFEDMDVCYGCLHRFPEGDDPAGEGAIDAARERQALKSASLADELPRIDLRPASDQGMGEESTLDAPDFADAGVIDSATLNANEAIDPATAGPIELELVGPADAGLSELAGFDADWILRLELRCPEEPTRSWLISLSHPPRLLAA